MPFWSSRARAVRATRTEVYQGFEVFEVRWDEFVDRWIDGLTRPTRPSPWCAARA